MYLIAIGWIYVVFMMSITETSVVAGVATFLFYGLIPVTLILYLGGSRRRRLKKHMEEELKREASRSSSESAVNHEVDKTSRP